MRLHALAMLAAVGAASANASVDCARCHPAEAKLHQQSAHAMALMRPATSLFFTRLSGRPLSEGQGGYSFSYKSPEDPSNLAIEVTVQRTSEQITAPLVWVFGSGRQGQTPVLFYARRFIEHRVSYYVATGYGITIGQTNGASVDAKKALGRVESDADARVCFNCHATSVSRDLARITPGVQCVRCHPAAEEHAERHGTPVNPSKLDHRAQVELCGECHRVKPPSGDENAIGNVRFQPLRLMKSLCFLKSDISCTTCHAAHRNAERDAPETYNRRCAGCHSHAATHVSALKNDNCVGCHMPKVKPAPGLVFTDHFIRIANH